ncbi:uncharacterized protein LOC129746340 [Uranotaenia lowii]|uniref:uncharacterized protein LOC129746340 n=1 Tax=Uranotaenia lowii TaxID=190385 RepID=UPI0024789BB3|nr:uncharacterized protein LOC129746340 [Uranotaenia lowii]XP_055595926.1 uncharacterized protein LOC129746340 [Uranotaenia lowii]XP_055595927.1 uncharacterized protein LOC129746340 [Uranotaenia lowii]
MLNSLEVLAGKISPGSGKNSPPTVGLDGNGNKVLLGGGGYAAQHNHHHSLLHAAKHPYQKPPGHSNNNITSNVVNNPMVNAGALVAVAAVGGQLAVTPGGAGQAIVGSSNGGTMPVAAMPGEVALHPCGRMADVPDGGVAAMQIELNAAKEKEPKSCAQRPITRDNVSLPVRYFRDAYRWKYYETGKRCGPKS